MFDFIDSSNTRGTKEIQRGEKELPAKKAELPSDCGRAEGEKDYSV